MPQYKPAGARPWRSGSTRRPTRATRRGSTPARPSDKYIRVTVILASVLFLVGISTHFPYRAVRFGLVIVGAALLIFAGVQLLQLPGLPS